VRGGVARAERKARPDDAPEWRLFQLAFILLNLPSVEDEGHPDRDLVELIFFPTGGGKTQAYLGLIAFTLLLRRLRGQERDDKGLGVAVLLRYTLRLLTLDQLGRAAPRRSSARSRCCASRSPGGSGTCASYDPQGKGYKSLLRTVLEPVENLTPDELKFEAPLSMRDVEASVHLWIQRQPLGGYRTPKAATEEVKDGEQ
jgi:hypothetical protein